MGEWGIGERRAALPILEIQAKIPSFVRGATDFGLMQIYIKSLHCRHTKPYKICSDPPLRTLTQRLQEIRFKHCKVPGDYMLLMWEDYGSRVQKAVGVGENVMSLVCVMNIS